ncbi:hypothetical protein SAMN05216591_3265 [Pseudomonas extremaustralis]|uniref:Uncharacterized protein n=1 Tax=Pseudomonas extremaustralis TaxID=359110 RepID=A0ABY0NJ28_9PSED|nr:hypothetical protein SAMN05216591_3265 [Pseudomonas extremaustralis]
MLVASPLSRFLMNGGDNHPDILSFKLHRWR